MFALFWVPATRVAGRAGGGGGMVRDGLLSKGRLISESVSCSVVSDSLWPHGLQPTRLHCPWDSPGKNSAVGSHSSPGDLPDPEIKHGSPTLQADSLLSEPPGKPSASSVFLQNIRAGHTVISIETPTGNWNFPLPDSVASSLIPKSDMAEPLVRCKTLLESFIYF